MTLLDLADAARSSGLTVVELSGWRTNISPGGFDPDGILVHHTAGASDDRRYAEWMAFTGRPPTVPPPLCNLALSRGGVVYVASSGNANHAGQARASGPMPAASDGNVLYLGIEAMNTGSEGWTAVQYDAYVALCAALCRWYGWPATHVRAHRETSVKGKVDPSGRTPHDPAFDMDRFRGHIAARLEDDMALSDDDKAWIKATIEDGPKVDLGDGRTWTNDQVARSTLRKLDNIIGRVDVDAIAKAVAANLGGLVGNGVSIEALEAAAAEGVRSVLREGVGE